jgi:hypothetical protein
MLWLLFTFFAETLALSSHRVGEAAIRMESKALRKLGNSGICLTVFGDSPKHRDTAECYTEPEVVNFIFWSIVLLAMLIYCMRK